VGTFPPCINLRREEEGVEGVRGVERGREFVVFDYAYSLPSLRKLGVRYVNYQKERGTKGICKNKITKNKTKPKKKNTKKKPLTHILCSEQKPEVLSKLLQAAPGLFVRAWQPRIIVPLLFSRFGGLEKYIAHGRSARPIFNQHATACERYHSRKLREIRFG
jgi:hypothetical protein